MGSAAAGREAIDASAFWVSAPGAGEIRRVRVPAPAAGEVRVHTTCSGVSRGTEALVFRGAVPESQYTAMRAPFQDGDFPAPVKYGYLNVGVVRDGPAALRGRTVFCLYPHQTAYVVPASAVHVVPETVPPRRAVLAGAVETAINALWDAPPLLGDRVAVIGAGMIGCCTAALLARFPGVEVTLVDVAAARADAAAALGAGFAHPDEVAGPFDLVVHASASSAGLQRALELLRPDGIVVELSWYGETPVTVPLGVDFHTRRLTIRASQVGTIAPARRASRTHADRLALALDQLRDPAFDALLTGSSRFDELPSVMAKLSDGSLPALCHTIRYDEEPPACSA
jgi:NADPH:quinone reductase-like Zn-dependent oxidoreductase